MQSQVFGDSAFGAGQQVQFLNLMMHDQKFFNYAQAIPVSISDFTLPACQLVYEVLSNYYREYSHAPKMATLEHAVTQAVQGGAKNVQTDITPEEYESLANVMYQMAAPPEIDADYGQAALFEYIQQIRSKQIVAKYADVMARNMGTGDMLRELAAVESLKPPGCTVELRSLLGDADQALIVSPEELACVPTGINQLDMALNGGLSIPKSDLGLGVALTGVGKTNMLINFALTAAAAGYRVLFISLELSTVEIMQRALAMAAHIDARRVTQAVTTWTEAEMRRYEAVRCSVIKDHIRIAELRDRQYSMPEIRRVVDAWKTQIMKEAAAAGQIVRGGLVLLDWLDMLTPDLSIVKKRNDGSEWQIMGQIAMDLRHMLNEFGLAGWTVTQATRAAVTAPRIRMDHTASGMGKLHYVSAAVGLSAPMVDKFIDEGIDDDNMERGGRMSCNRNLTMSIMKNRHGPPGVIDNLWQGPSLKIWNSRAMYQAAQTLIDQGDLRKIFGHILPDVNQ